MASLGDAGPHLGGELADVKVNLLHEIRAEGRGHDPPDPPVGGTFLGEDVVAVEILARFTLEVVPVTVGKLLPPLEDFADGVVAGHQGDLLVERMVLRRDRALDGQLIQRFHRCLIVRPVQRVEPDGAPQLAASSLPRGVTLHHCVHSDLQFCFCTPVRLKPSAWRENL